MGDIPRKGLFKTEEWQPVIIGVLAIALVILGVRITLPAFRWMGGPAYRSGLQASLPAVNALAAEAAAADEAALSQAFGDMQRAAGGYDRAAMGAAAEAAMQAAKGAKDAALGKRATDLARKIRDDSRAVFTNLLVSSNLLNSAILAGAMLILALLAVGLSGGRLGAFILGFPVVYALSWIAQAIAGNTGITYWGLEYVVFALAIGLFISNVIGVPKWLQEAVRTELYIKIGLVLLGAGILFPEILQAGVLGIIQALLVVGAVWYACYWISRKLKVDDEFAAILSSAVSICGVSAAIAACGAIQGDKKKLSYVISLTLIVAIPMMITMPWIVRLLKIPDVIAGAWMGGTLDTTGSVVAATALVSDASMKIGTIVKFSQNVFIGIAAFLLSLWWSFRKKGNGPGAEAAKPGAKVIWERFPKFVLGFLAASLLFSFILDPGLVKQTKGLLSGLRTAWFGVTFVSIGLETKLSGLLKMGKGKPALAFVAAQLFNVLWTLLIAYVLFGGNIFPLVSFGP